jgi:hypothetical protein
MRMGQVGTGALADGSSSAATATAAAAGGEGVVVRIHGKRRTVKGRVMGRVQQQWMLQVVLMMLMVLTVTAAAVAGQRARGVRVLWRGWLLLRRLWIL